jgi:hypothetical protein
MKVLQVALSTIFSMADNPARCRHLDETSQSEDRVTSDCYRSMPQIAHAETIDQIRKGLQSKRTQGVKRTHLSRLFYFQRSILHERYTCFFICNPRSKLRAGRGIQTMSLILSSSSFYPAHVCTTSEIVSVNFSRQHAKYLMLIVSYRVFRNKNVLKTNLFTLTRCSLSVKHLHTQVPNRSKDSSTRVKLRKQI